MDELQQLQGEALAADASAAPPVQPVIGPDGQPVQEPQPVDVAGEVAAMMKIAVGILSPVLPSLGEIYTEQTIGACSKAIAGVCVKHGWLNDGLMGKWGEEIAAAAILLPIGYATYNGVRGDLDNLKEKAKAKGGKVKPADLTAPAKPEAVPTSAPGAKTVTMGTVVQVPEGGTSEQQ